MAFDRWSDNELSAFKRAFDDHVLREAQMHDELMRCVRENTEAVRQLRTETEGMVEAWEAGRGVLKIARWAGNIGKWLASVAILGALFKWLAEHGSH